MIILVGIGCFMAGAVVGIVMMSLCVASHNSSLELENRQKAGAGGQAKGWGWRCRYCGRTYKDLREEAEYKERERRSRTW
mgnify:CR=1 FL=1